MWSAVVSLGIVSPMFKGGMDTVDGMWHITFHLGTRGSGSTRLVPVWGEFKLICLFFHAVVSHPCTPDYKGPQRAVWPHTQNCGSGNSDMSDHIFHPKVSRQVTQVINTFTCRNTRSIRKISWKKMKIAQGEEVCKGRWVLMVMKNLCDKTKKIDQKYVYISNLF